MSTNYIQHLNKFFEKVYEDDRLNATHISIYMALFQLWNVARFTDEFLINRNDVMRLSKIGSKNTYHKCLKELTQWKYIKYTPSHNPTIGSKIYMYNFGTSTVQALGHLGLKNGTSTVQVVGHNYINYNKHIKHKTSKKKNLKNDFLKVTKNKNYNQPL